MKVSIIIPTYNVEAYITECLESVARQTYQGEIECLVVDDCGTDGSIAVAEQFIQSYQGNIIFRIIHHDHNRGLSAARNTGTNAATGDYIYYLDSDDVIAPDTIEEMVQLVCRHPQVEMIQGGIIDMKGGIISDFTTIQLPEYTDNREWIYKNMFFRLPVSSWNRMIKREFLIKEGISFHEGIIHEDVPYCFLLSLKCHSVGFVPKNTYICRTQRVGSITNTPQGEYAVQSRIIIMSDCMNAYLSFQKPNKILQEYALRALWSKWLSYMVINQRKILLMHKEEISDITRQLCAITPWLWKIPAVIYSALPIKVKQNKLFLKLSRQC